MRPSTRSMIRSGRSASRRSWVTTRKVTFLVVTHDRRLAERTDRIIDLVDGRIVSDQANGSEH